MPLILGTIPICEVDEDKIAKTVENLRLSGHMQGPEIECMAQYCRNKGNLRKCSKCKSVRYCSVECQKRNWPHHKAHCAHVQEVTAISDNQDLQWDRNLRHWNERFKISLQKAYAYGLDLYNDHSNVDRLGMIVILSPRLHADSGARFTLKEVRVVHIDDLFTQLRRTTKSADTMIELWKIQRERLKEEREGRCDYGLLSLQVDHESFRRFTDAPFPLPKLKITAVYWYAIETASQGREAKHWACDFGMEILLNVPQRLEFDDEDEQ